MNLVYLERSSKSASLLFLFLILIVIIASTAVILLGSRLARFTPSRLQPQLTTSWPYQSPPFHQPSTPAYPTFTPTPTPADFTPPPLPPGLKWILVPASQQKVNTRALGWSTKPVRCIATNCRTPFIVNSGYFVLTGKEWVTHQIVNSYQEHLVLSPPYNFYTEASLINWNPGEADLGPGLPDLWAEGGVMGLDYNPECAFAIRSQQVRVACLVAFISPKDVSGQGMQAHYIYPFLEELRFFIT